MALEQVALAPARSPYRGRSRRSPAPRPMRAPRTRSASPTRTWCAAFAGTSSIRPTSSRQPARGERARAGARVVRRRERVAAIPFGGGTSVVGGVTPHVGPSYNGAISIDLGALDGVLEVDQVSRSARIQARRARARARGAARRARADAAPLPAVVRVLHARRLDRNPRRRPLRDRLDAHRGSRRVRARDDPAGRRESRRLPARAPGRQPRPDARGLRGDARRDHPGVGARAAATAQRAPRACASRASPRARTVRAISQSGLHPSNCRLLDAGEAASRGAGGRLTRAARARLRVDRSSGRGVRWRERSRSAPSTAGGVAPSSAGEDGGAAAARARRRGGEAFLAPPTCATCSSRRACSPRPSRPRSPGSASPAFHAAGRGRRRAGGARARAAAGRVFCRFTHVYPDGPAPYFTVIAPARRGRRDRAVGRDQARGADAIIARGGTITHHHAVGRDHRPWYDRQRPEPFAQALRGAKAAVDPAGS